MTVSAPKLMNEAFADAFNSRKIENLLALYEPGAVLRTDGSERDVMGLKAIESELRKLLNAPGTMVSRNSFCILFDDIALLRADWRLSLANGDMVAEGSSAEVVRRQPDGSWLYVIDHAAGSGLARLF